MTEHQHQFSEDRVSVLCAEARLYQSSVAEVACKVSEEQSLNRDQGRHTLPAIYARLVKSWDILSHLVT